MNYDLSISLDRPFLPIDIQAGGNDIVFDSEGYIEDEDDDEDMIDNNEESLFKKNSNKNKKSSTKSLQKGVIKLKSNARKVRKEEKSDHSINNSSNNPDLLIESINELEQVLNDKTKDSNIKYNLNYIDKEFLVDGSKEIVGILKDEDLLIILRYLYTELHPGLVELSDNFVEERRKYMAADHDTYTSIINYFLRKKEEFFLCVLSEVMSKLSISQKALDNTFHYYINMADPELETVLMIKESYNKLYHAGIK